MADFDLDDIEARRPAGRREGAQLRVDGLWVDCVLLTPGERDALIAVARWAQNAPHHAECGALASNYQFGTPIKGCTCGRDELISRG